jgi:hypothetical protein
MKIQRILLCILILLIADIAKAKQIVIAEGKPSAKALAFLRQNATDLGPGLEIIGPNGEWPIRDIWWELKEVGLILQFSADSEKILELNYWTDKDFNTGKEKRFGLEKRANSIALDLDKKTFKIEKDGKIIASNIIELEKTDLNAKRDCPAYKTQHSWCNCCYCRKNRCHWHR